jgi:hypothetical protein
MSTDDRQAAAAPVPAVQRERRKYPRRREEWPASVRDMFDELVALGFTENLSEGGLRLVCRGRTRVPTEEPLSVKICLLNRHGAVVSEYDHACRIVYVQDREDGKIAIGLQFLDEPQEDSDQP